MRRGSEGLTAALSRENEAGPGGGPASLFRNITLQGEAEWSPIAIMRPNKRTERLGRRDVRSAHSAPAVWAADTDWSA
jgi:hypothetical protein